MTAGPFEPNSSVLFCPLCDEHIYTHSPSDLRYPEVIAIEIDSAAEDHLARRHPRRYRWYKRTGWSIWVRGIRGSLAA